VLQSIRAGHWQKNGWQKNEVGVDVSSNPKQRLVRLTIFLPPHLFACGSYAGHFSVVPQCDLSAQLLRCRLMHHPPPPGLRSVIDREPVYGCSSIWDRAVIRDGAVPTDSGRCTGGQCPDRTVVRARVRRQRCFSRFEPATGRKMGGRKMRLGPMFPVIQNSGLTV